NLVLEIDLGQPEVSELKDMVKALLLNKKNQTQAPAPVKAVEESCVTCGGAHFGIRIKASAKLISKLKSLKIS
ncbi:hypothetical protein Tco_0274384, partial [Tanacetum coccineum]